MESTKFKLFTPSQKFKPDRISLKKVAIIGSGKVASSIAFSLVLKEVCDHVVIVDKNEERLKAETQDYQYGSYFLTSRPKIQATTDFSSAKGAKIVILAIDVTKIEGEDFTEVLQRNVDVYKATVPNAVQFCSDAIFIVVSATCDILSYVTWKLSGLPQSSIIGIGTSVETARFRCMIANKLEISPSHVEGSWIVGEQNKNFPLWASVSFLGVKLNDLNANAGDIERDQENWMQICKEMEKSKNLIVKNKQNCDYAIALCCCDLITSILNDKNEIKTVSVMVKELFGIDKEVFLSTPCMLSSAGVGDYLNLKLNDKELKALRNSANIIDEIQMGINF